MTGQVRTPGRDELHAIAAKVQLVVLDVDGVLTDGGLHYGAGGEVMKRFDVKDGHAIVFSRTAGLQTAVLTARQSDIVATRGRELGMVAIVQGRKDKGAALRELLESLQVSPEACAYMGDDLNDLAPMSQVGLPACPVDAVREVRAQALFISQNPGGHGAVRELLELCLKASGRWDAVVDGCVR